jgi:hypothetical protein
MHRGIDAVDLMPQIGERSSCFVRRFWHGLASGIRPD